MYVTVSRFGYSVQLHSRLRIIFRDFPKLTDIQLGANITWFFIHELHTIHDKFQYKTDPKKEAFNPQTFHD